MNLKDMGFEKEREEYIRLCCIIFNAISLTTVEKSFDDIKRKNNY